jgi:hypothetical protein
MIHANRQAADPIGWAAEAFEWASTYLLSESSFFLLSFLFFHDSPRTDSPHSSPLRSLASRRNLRQRVHPHDLRRSSPPSSPFHSSLVNPLSPTHRAPSSTSSPPPNVAVTPPSSPPVVRCSGRASCGRTSRTRRRDGRRRTRRRILILLRGVCMRVRRRGGRRVWSREECGVEGVRGRRK